MKNVVAGAWGHEFVRNLAGEIGAEFIERTTAEPRGDVTDLLKERGPLEHRSTVAYSLLHCRADGRSVGCIALVRRVHASSSKPSGRDAPDRAPLSGLQGPLTHSLAYIGVPTASGWLPSVGRALELVRDIVPYHMKHNAEPEACDLLMEVDLLPEIKARAHFLFERTHLMTRSALRCEIRAALCGLCDRRWPAARMRSRLAHTAVLHRRLLVSAPACERQRTRADRPIGLRRSP